MKLPRALESLDTISRRRFLQSGTLAAASLAFGRPLGFLPAARAAGTPEGKAKAVIQIWMWGGPSHLDTFDPKPGAGSDYTGPLAKPLATNADGMIIGELMPELAKNADKFSLIRSMTHGSNAHETAAYMVQTGHAEGGHLVYPSAGAVVSMEKGKDAGGLLPPYIVLTEPQGRFSECGFLGPSFKPFATGGNPAKVPFAVEGIVLEGISTRRQQERRVLLQDLDTLGSAMKDDPQLAEFDRVGNAAYDMILGDGAKVFDLAQEGDAMLDWYGRNTFGQSCLVARRLVERGVKYVTINSKGWDTHKQNFQAIRQKLPEFDRGVAALLQDLARLGLLESTVVFCCGEFGRTPKVQWDAPWNGGRGHWGKVFSALVAGGGFRGGHVVGASDAKGEEVADRPVYPWDLIGSIYEVMGIDPNAAFPRMGDADIHLVEQAGGKIPSGGPLREIM